MVAAVFDCVRSYRAYAITDAGDFLALVVPHTSKPGACKVRSGGFGGMYGGAPHQQARRMQMSVGEGGALRYRVWFGNVWCA
eukprot:365789-Chlamydomonas_euryale.AAC.3